MARPLRTEIAGGMHHVTARTPSGRSLFRDDADHETYLGLLGAEVRKRSWQVATYCLMGNHIHLLVRTPAPDLGLGIKTVHERFATYVNKRRAEHGHVFGGRFYNGLVADGAHFHASLRYIARNPVAAGLCKRAADWRWSGHGALMGTGEPGFVDVSATLRLIDERSDVAQASYAGWVGEPDIAVLAKLEEAAAREEWVATAVDLHGIDPSSIMQFKGWSRPTVYRRLRLARDTQGSGP